MKNRILVLMFTALAGATLSACDDTTAPSDTAELETAAEASAGFAMSDGAMANSGNHGPCVPWIGCWGGLTAPAAQPEPALGITWVWDGDAGAYVASDRPGAPQDGYRLITYLMDPATLVPTQPLVELGFLDVVTRDVEVGSSFDMVVASTRGPAPDTVADYVLTGASTGGGLPLHMEGHGRVFGTADIVEVDVVEDWQLTGAGTLEVGLDFDVALASGAAAVAYDGVITRASDGTDQLDMTIDLTAPGTELTTSFVIDRYGTEAAPIAGTVWLHGAAVATVSGTEADPVFTDPAGGALSAVDVVALEVVYANLYGLAGVLDALTPPSYFLAH